MTPLQARRDEVCGAIAAHIAAIGPINWNQVQARFPDLPPATFWRWVKRVRAGVSNGMADAGARPKSIRAGRSGYLLTFSEPLAQAQGRLLSVGELMVIYDAEVLSSHRSGASARRSLAPIVGPLAHKICHQLTAEDISPIVDPIALRAPVHANRMLAYLSAFCSWAMVHEQMDFNPMSWMERAVIEAPRERSLSLDELVEIWRAANQLGYPFGPAIQLLILTAARREEVAGMRRGDLKWSPDYLDWSLLEHNLGDQWTFVIPLPPQARPILWDAMLAAPDRSDLIFTTTGSTPISGWSRAKRRLDAIIRTRRHIGRKGGADMAPWRLNDLRRSFVDLSYEHLGGDPQILGRCLNRMTQYTRLHHRPLADDPATFQQRREALISWANLIERAVRDRPARRRVKSRPSSAASAPARRTRPAGRPQAPG
jgi:integrase